MNSPSDPTKIPGTSKARRTPRVDKIVEHIWNKSSQRKEETKDKPIEVFYLDSSNSTGKNTPEVFTLESTPNGETPIAEAEPLATNETEEHEAGHSALSRILSRETFTIPQIFEPKTLPIGGGGCYGGIPQGIQLSHIILDTQSLGIATKHQNLLI